MKITCPSATLVMLAMLPSSVAGGGGKSPIVVPSRSHWEIHGGLGVRQSFDFNLKSSAGNLLGGEFSPSAANSALFAGIGPVDAEANRLYDDGLVNIGSDFNLTSYWSYDHESQVGQSSQAWDASQPWDSPGNQSLYLTRAAETGLAGYASGARSGEEVFPYLEARRWWDCQKESFWAEKGLVAAWAWTPAAAGMRQDLAVERTTVVDEYYLYGVVPPSAPYAGPPLPPGPLLDNIPHSREVSNGASGALAATRANVALDLHTFSLGGIWRYAPDEDRSSFECIGLYGLDLQGGVSLNFARLKLRSSTTVSEQGEMIGSFRQSASNSEVLPGLYLALGASFDIGEDEDWRIFTQGRYDHVGEIDVRAGLASAEVDLKGFSLSIGIGRKW